MVMQSKKKIRRLYWSNEKLFLTGVYLSDQSFPGDRSIMVQAMCAWISRTSADCLFPWATKV